MISSILVWYHVPFYERPRYTYAWLGYKYGATIRHDYVFDYTGEQMLTAWQMATDKIEDEYNGTCADLDSAPIPEGLLDTREYQLPPSYANDLGGMIEDMGDFAKAFYNYLGGQGLGSCVQTYAIPGLPDDNTLMGYCNAPATPLERW